MKLFCRGNTYDYDPGKTPKRPFQSVERSGTAYSVTCRGITYTIDPSAQSVKGGDRVQIYQLISRGVTYFVHWTAAGGSSIDIVYGLCKLPTRDLYYG
jgi:Domain of unknown function (DUF4278)